MKIGVDFNKPVYATKENINKLLSSGVVYEEDEFTDYLCYDYFIDVDTLEEFDEVLHKNRILKQLALGHKMDPPLPQGNPYQRNVPEALVVWCDDRAACRHVFQSTDLPAQQYTKQKPTGNPDKKIDNAIHDRTALDKWSQSLTRQLRLTFR